MEFTTSVENPMAAPAVMLPVMAQPIRVLVTNISSLQVKTFAQVLRCRSGMLYLIKKREMTALMAMGIDTIAVHSVAVTSFLFSSSARNFSNSSSVRDIRFSSAEYRSAQSSTCASRLSCSMGPVLAVLICSPNFISLRLVLKSALWRWHCQC